MPPLRACRPRDLEAYGQYLKVRTHPVPQSQNARATTTVSPEEFYAFLRSTHEQAQRKGKEGKLNVTGEANTQREFIEVDRNGRPKMKITRAFLSCFFDLAIPEVGEILLLPERVLRRVKTWAGLTWWPRKIVVTNTHPIYNRLAVRNKRLEMLQWTMENRDFYGYEALYSAHKKAGCRMDGIPPPLEVRDLPGLCARLISQPRAEPESRIPVAEAEAIVERSPVCREEPVAAPTCEEAQTIPDFDQELADYVGGWDFSETWDWDAGGRATPTVEDIIGRPQL